MTRIALISNSVHADWRFQAQLSNRTFKYLHGHFIPRFLVRSSVISPSFLNEMETFAGTLEGRTTVILMLGEQDRYMCAQPQAIADRIAEAISTILKAKEGKFNFIIGGLVPPFDQSMKMEYAEVDRHIKKMIRNHPARRKIVFSNLAQAVEDKLFYKKMYTLKDSGVIEVVEKLMVLLNKIG